jgi:hypothetical protein
MTTQAPQLLSMLDEDLYRLGKSTSPKLNNVRPDDVTVYDRNGIVMVRADGFDVSLITEERLKKQRPGSYAWKLPANFSLPNGLALIPDTRFLTPGKNPDHYFLCPQSDMTLGEYMALLSKLALALERVRKL